MRGFGYPPYWYFVHRQLSCRRRPMIRRHLDRMYWRAVWLVAMFALRGLYSN
jgi:hypothetical protein